VSHLRSKTPLTASDCLRGRPTRIQRGLGSNKFAIPPSRTDPLSPSPSPPPASSPCRYPSSAPSLLRRRGRRAVRPQAKELRGAGRGRSGGPASARRPHGAAATADDGRDGKATGGRRARSCPASAWRLPPPPTRRPPDPPQAGRVRLPAAFSWGAGLLTSAARLPRARPQGAARRGLLRSDAGGWEDAGGDGEGEREGQFGRVELQICWIRVHVGSELAVHVDGQRRF